VQHPAVIRVRAWCPDGPDPHLVTLHPPALLTPKVGTLDRDQSVAVVVQLASALSHAHQLGIGHGRLCPSRIWLNEAGSPLIDLFGLDTGDPTLTSYDEPCFRSSDAHPHQRDVFALGMLCVVLLTSREIKGPAGAALPRNAITQVADAGTHLSALIAEMIDADPAARPSMHEVATRLQRADISKLFTAVSPGTTAAPTPDPEENAPDLEPGNRLGRYDLLELLGEGGMGKVFRATDIADGTTVAVKVLHARWSHDDEALRRFYREARLLAQLENPHIARFIDANEVQGVHYLVMEFVAGNSLHEALQEENSLSVDLALTLTRDMALALADVHDLGIVHRDIKPANILLLGSGERRHAKLCDFGIAREVAGDNDLTRAGLTVGTPHYMSPEQCVGSEVSPASDIYALGITLFKMLAGYVPFNAGDAQAIVYKHLAEPVPDIRTIVPGITEGAARVLRRMLEKEPDARIANARALLDELEPVRTGDKTDIAVHPRLPADATNIITYDFEWRLECTPAELWPHVSHTERLNRAIGLGSIHFSRQLDDEGTVRTRGTLKMSGITLDWQEHPYEWVAPTRMGVLREFSAGPFHWLRSSVELSPEGSGTRLRHQVQVQPRGLLGKAAAAMEVGYKARKNLEAVYRRIDQTVAQSRSRAGAASGLIGDGARSQSTDDPFEEAPQLTHAIETRIDGIERELSTYVDAGVAERLCDYVRRAPPQEAARIRPRAFAARHQIDHRVVLRACLRGARLGLLVMLWDVICPRCRIPSNIVDSLQALREHDHCDACDLDFELDFGRSVEIIFRADPGLRDTELGTFCIGGPGHTPHVMMQIRLAPNERFEADLMLEEGHYRVAGRQLPTTWGFTVRRGAGLRHWELVVRDGASSAEVVSEEPTLHMQTQSATPHRAIDAGRQRIIICNETTHEVVARVEREGERANAITAAEAAATAAFRELFPSEVLSPEHLISIGRVTLLVAEADVWSGADEGEAFARLNELSRIVTRHVEATGGAVIKIHGDGVMAAFTSVADATRAALTLVNSRLAGLRVAVHTGAAMATSINDRLDYFGRLVRQLEHLVRGVECGCAAISEASYADSEVASLLSHFAVPLGLVTTQDVLGMIIPPSDVEESSRSPDDERRRANDGEIPPAADARP
jgi:serine/threonine protein kinase